MRIGDLSIPVDSATVVITQLVLLLLLVLPLVEANTHGHDDSHVDVGSDGDGICLLAEEDLAHVEELAVDGRDRQLRGLVCNVGLCVEEVALHEQGLLFAQCGLECAD
jgi:hypothetical protein